MASIHEDCSNDIAFEHLNVHYKNTEPVRIFVEILSNKGTFLLWGNWLGF